jgi:hypothetical protein
MKTYPITLAKKFQRPHPQTGEPTNFKERILNGFNHEYKNDRGLIYPAKIHTGRENYALWEHRCKEVNAGRAVLSLRQWSDKPYRSKQTSMGLELTQVTCQKLEVIIYYANLNHLGPTTLAHIRIDDNLLNTIQMMSFIQSDGFDDAVDFMHWFGWKNWEGALIHFKPDFKY